MNRAANKVIHLGVQAAEKDGTELVPYCDIGYTAFQANSLVKVTTLMGEVTCIICVKRVKALLQ